MNEQHDFEALEQIELAAMTDYFRAAPEAVQAAHAIEVREVGPATCLICRDVEPAAIFRRAVGLGVREPATQDDLDAVAAHMKERARTYAVAVAAEHRPPELASWLEKRGFERGYAWMKFQRPCQGVPAVDCDLDVRVIGPDLSGAFGRIVTEGFGMPASVAPWIGALAARKHWICVLAFADETPVAAGAAFYSGDYAWLGLGTTLPSHRRQGAQNALLARRLNEAAARGARVAVTETGERLPDKPSNSYRNILRAGFKETYLRQNYVWSAT